MLDKKGLFIIGNKRSGSTQLMKLLNIHPKVFISNETDILWILYHFHKDLKLSPYEHDSPTGMNGSLKKAGHVLKRDDSVFENFINYQNLIMKEGFLSEKPADKDNLAYVGDQKPYQNADPDIIQFVNDHLPNSKFIHLVRHPFLVTTSSKKFLNGNNDIWSGLTDKELLDKWVMHEHNVLEAIKTHNIDYLRVKYEDMIANPSDFMDKIYDFLELEYSQNELLEAKRITKKNYKPITNYEIFEELTSLLDNYNYVHSFNYYKSTLKPYIYKYYNKIKRKLN